MFNISEYRHQAKRLSDFLPWAALIDPQVILNKDGSFMCIIRFRGPDLDSSSDHELVGVRARMNNALKRLGSRWCLHIEAARMPSRAYPRSEFPDLVTYAIDDERRASFEADQTHFESEYYLSFTYLPPEDKIAAGRDLFITPGSPGPAPGHTDSDRSSSEKRNLRNNFRGRGRGFDYRQELEQFRRRVDQVVSLLRGFMPEVGYLREADLLTYLHGCVSTRRLHVAMPPTPFYLDEMLTDDVLTGGFEPKLDEEYLKTVSIHAYAHRTTPGLLDTLNQLSIAYRWVVRWLPMDKTDAEKHIGSIRRQWFAKRKGLMALLREAITKEPTTLEDSDSLNKAQDADEALQFLGADLCSYGYLTLTITVWDGDPRIAQEKAAAVQQIVDGTGLVSKIESVNAVEAWLGTLPGHAYADVRRPLIGSLNLCDLIPLSAVWSGPRRCDHLDGPVLMQTRTKGSTPFRLDLFQGDVGHTMVCGPTGAGKSTLLSLMAAQWRRYQGGQVYFFDKGGSCKVLTHAVGGDYYDLGATEESSDHRTLSFQPLGRVHEEAERVWAQQWLLDILGRENVESTPTLKEEIWRVLELLGSDYEPPDRTLSSFTNLLQSQASKEALRRYTLQGPYGRLLDAHEDGLDTASWQAFETEELMKSPAAMVPVLTYLFHRLEDRFAGEDKGGRPTLLILDEAWVFLSEGFFAQKIHEWLKVLRKRNVAVVFATQSLADIRQCAIAPALIENCPTRLFLPNPRAMEPNVRDVYESFGLSEQQLRILATATPKRDYYYQSRDGNRLFELNFGELSLAFCGGSSHADRKLADKLRRSHPPDQFGLRFLIAKDMHENAELISGKHETVGQKTDGRND